ncbi:hypothetical protein Mapa_001727 [Marchantia paleacea]|nr:hypothetical protein Mapa_001727 [Marchantia paleacea]
MAASLAVSPCFARLPTQSSSSEAFSGLSSSAARSNTACPRAFRMSASTIWSRENPIALRACAPMRKSVLAKCASTSAVFEQAESIPSLYNLLGLDHDVTLPEIKTAYRQMARQYHPDVCPREKVEECTRKFLEVQHAYDTLSDPEKRAEYDYEISCTHLSASHSWRFQCRKASRRTMSRDHDCWRSKWEQQLENLLHKDATDHVSQSWGARMRRCHSQK